MSVTTRLQWSEVPEPLAEQIGEVCGGQIQAAEGRHRGFSSGVAARVQTSGGGRAFVKAISARRNAETVELFRREARVLRRIQGRAKSADLIAELAHDDWLALVIEDVEGRHPEPSDVTRVLDALTELPEDHADDVLPALHDELAPDLRGWENLADAAAQDLPEWARRNYGDLRRRMSEADEAVRGSHLVHGDFRDDNILIDRNGEVRIVDWPWACVGCRWFDALTYLLELRRIGADVDAERLTSEHPIFADVEPAAVTAVLSALAGTFLDRARRPAPPAMPALRAFQRDEGEASLAWVRARVERRPMVF